MRLSIVIPIYNVQDHVAACLDSIYSQKFNEGEFEILAVNDGTPDQSMDVVASYAAQHSNLRMLNKPNGGVSSARNLGIEQAKGDFILFVDGDDKIKANTLCSLNQFLSDKPETELVVMKSFSQKGIERYAWNDSLVERDTYTGVEAFQHGFYRGSVCGVAFSSHFIKTINLRFPEGIKNAEDAIFFTYAQAVAKKMCFLGLNFYEVVEREGSASRGISSELFLNNMVQSLCFVLEDDRNKSLTPNQNGLIEFLKYRMLYNAIRIACKGKGLKGYITIKDIVKAHQLLPLNESVIATKRGKVKLLNASLPLFYLLTYMKK